MMTPAEVGTSRNLVVVRRMVCPLLFLLVGLLATATQAEVAVWPGCYPSCDGVSLVGIEMWHSTIKDGLFRNSTWTSVGMGGSDASMSDFTGSTFVGASANHIKWNSATLVDVDFTGANLDHSSFKSADLTGAVGLRDSSTILSNIWIDPSTVFDDGKTWLETAFFDAESGMRGMKVEMFRQDVSGLDMRPEADPIHYSSFDGWSFTQLKAHGTNFAGCSMRNAAMWQLQATSADFTDADLSGSPLGHSNLQGTNFRGATFTGASLSNCNFIGADFTHAIGLRGDDVDLSNAKCDPTTLFDDGLTWLETTFFESGLRGMKVEMFRQDVSGLDMRPEADPIRFASFDRWSFTQLKAHGTNFAGCSMRNAAMWQLQATNADFSHADLTSAPMHYSNLQGANFEGAVLDQTGLKHCNMIGCNLVGVDLSTAVFDDTTTMTDCTYDSTTVFPSHFDASSKGLINVDAVAPAVVWPECYPFCDGVSLLGKEMWHSTIKDGLFRNSTWTSVGMGGSDASTSDFTGSTFVGASANHIKWNSAMLVQVDFTGTNLDHSSFKGTDLTGAVGLRDSSTILSNIWIDPSTVFDDGLTWLETTFFDAESGMRGMKVEMFRQDVSGLDMRPEADPIRYASFDGWSFTQLKAHGTNFSGCSMKNAAMWQLQATNADFSNADLTSSPMHYSNLRGANFQGAVLDQTGMTHCNMAGCNLIGTDLSTAGIDDTTTMTDCTYDATTIFPGNFDPSSKGLIDVDAPTLDPTASPTGAPTTKSPTASPTITPTSFPVPSLNELSSNTLYFDDVPCFSMGINLAGVTYYSSQWTFKNAFLESGGCCWPSDAVVDADGNLLEVPSEESNEHWIAGRNLIYRVDGQYPGGTYVLHAEGTGTITLAFDVGSTQTISVPTDPDGHAVVVTPSGGGVQLTITETQSDDPVRNISFMLQEYEDDASSTSPFTTPFLQALSGMNVLRFMDMGRTNSNNIAHWKDRSTKTSFSQTITRSQEWNIAAVNILPPDSTTAATSSFTALALEITTTEPHDIVTGQMVEINNLVGTLTVSREGEDDLIVDLGSYLWWPRMAEATSNTTFLINPGRWWWNWDTYTLTGLSGASADTVVRHIKPGVAYEYMIDLSLETYSDPWFCVPHLASDEYVYEMATLIANSGLGPNMTVYVELSNEAWNNIFSQQQYQEAKKRELGLGAGADWHGQRSKQIFDIFEQVFASTEGAPKLNRVLAGQSVNTWISERIITAAGGMGSFDSLAIAPYFGVHAQDVFDLGSGGGNISSVTVTDVLELCLQEIYGGFRYHVAAQKAVADQYGADLIAYEGGQHLGGQGPHPLGGRLENDQPYQDLMIATNRDPRMHNLYQAYFKLWSELTNGGTFAHFSFIGLPTKWGSWGMKESHYMGDTVEESPKFASVTGIASHCATN